MADAAARYGTMPPRQPEAAEVPLRHDSHFSVDPRQTYEALYGIAPANVHNAFIVKVYSLLAFELCFCAGVSAVVTFVPVLRDAFVSFIINHAILLEILIMCLFLASLCWLYSVQRLYPKNMLALVAFVCSTTLMMSYFSVVAYITGEGKVTLLAMGITAASFLVLTIYAWVGQLTGIEFSYKIGFVVAAVVASVLLLVVRHLFNSTWQIVLCGLGILIFIVWILVDTYLIKTKLGPDDALIASIQLFIDIINIFALAIDMILALLGKR